MAKRSAPSHNFAIHPIGRIETASPLTQANKKVADLQKKLVDLKKELDASQKAVVQANEIKEQAAQEVRAESDSMKRVIRQLQMENENLMKNHNNHQASVYSQTVQRQNIRMRELEEELTRVIQEKNCSIDRLNAEAQARQQLSIKMNDAIDMNNKLQAQVQHLQQSSAHRPDAPDVQRVLELNKDLQRRNDFLENENDFLKNEQANRAPPPPTPPSPNLERAYNEAKANCSTLIEEKNRMVNELKAAHDSEDKMKAQLEQAKWMANMMKEQLEFCQKNTEMWQENTKNLSEHLKRMNGTGMLHLQQQGMMQPQSLLLQQQQPCYSPSPSFMQQGHSPSPMSSLVPPALPSLPSFVSPKPRRRPSTAPSDVITLDDDDDTTKKRIKKEEEL